MHTLSPRAFDTWSDEQIRCRDVFLKKFAEALPGWLRQCGVHEADIADAVQEALLHGCESHDKILADASGPRQALLRIVSKVAVRSWRQMRRGAERYTNIEGSELADSREEAAWIEARTLLILAMEKLDKPSLALIYAHEIEGKTNLEIATALNEKEDTVKRRVLRANKRLRAEVERLVRGSESVRSREALLLCGAGFDPFDSALFGAVFETMGVTPRLSVAMNVTSIASMVSKIRGLAAPSIPTAALMSVLVIAPGSARPIDPRMNEEKHLSSVQSPHARTVPGAIDSAPQHAPFDYVAPVWVSMGCAASQTTPTAPAEPPAEPESTSDEDCGPTWCCAATIDQCYLDEETKRMVERQGVPGWD